MKVPSFFLLLLLTVPAFLEAQEVNANSSIQKEIASIIDQYSAARENRDTVLLKKILSEDVDQLVSNGEWRNGIAASVEGMLRSSANNPGTRSLVIEKTRLVSPTVAIADCRYDIKNANGSDRRMWSSFILVKKNGDWKISAIRNMLPAVQ